MAMGPDNGAPAEAEAQVAAARVGIPVYALPFEQRHAWGPPDKPPIGRVLERATRPR